MSSSRCEPFCEPFCEPRLVYLRLVYLRVPFLGAPALGGRLESPSEARVVFVSVFPNRPICSVNKNI